MSINTAHTIHWFCYLIHTEQLHAFIGHDFENGTDRQQTEMFIINEH